MAGADNPDFDLACGTCGHHVCSCPPKPEPNRPSAQLLPWCAKCARYGTMRWHQALDCQECYRCGWTFSSHLLP
jgi:hypothetical protein